MIIAVRLDVCASDQRRQELVIRVMDRVGIRVRPRLGLRVRLGLELGLGLGLRGKGFLLRIFVGTYPVRVRR